MRIDKFLKDSRIIKRRSVAKEACEIGRVMINDKLAKAGDKVETGDKLTISFGNGNLNVEVLELKKNAKKSEADSMYRVID